MKKQLLLFAMVLISSLVTADNNDFIKDGIAYKITSLNPAQLEVVAKDEGYEGNVIIPDIVMYEGVNFSITSIGEKAFNRSKITGITLPSKLKIIHKEAFAWCSGIKKLKLPNELETIEASAFVWCEMDSLIIPGSVQTLSSYCFAACNKLEYLEFEEGVTEIPELTFSSCDNLNKLVLPSSLNKIEAAAFDNTPVKFVISRRNTTPTIRGSYWFSGGRGTHTLYNPFTYSDSDDRPIYTLLVPFGAKDSYQSVTTQDGKAAWPVETIEEYDEKTDYTILGTVFTANNNNYMITNSGSVNNVQVIGTEDADSTGIIIPANIVYNQKSFVVNSINSTYFSRKKNIRDVTVDNDSPFEINENTFSNLTFLLGRLHVPKGKVEIYRETKGWNQFANIMEIKDMYKLKYIVDNEEYKAIEIEEGNTITPEPAPAKEGYTFSGWSEIPDTMPANDVTVTGTFSINSYKLSYMIDDEVYKDTVYEYGTTIVPEPMPKDNYVTFEWTDLPQTMPARDVVVHASYTTGIMDVLIATQRNMRIYSPDGKEIDKLQKGLNIVILDDGTVKKVVLR